MDNSYINYIRCIYLKDMSPSGQKCMMMGKHCSAVNSAVTLTANQMDSAQVKAEFRLKLTVPGRPAGPEALFSGW